MDIKEEETAGTAAVFAGGVALGALIGAALGVIFAPSAGSETRERIGDWTRRARHGANEAVSNAASAYREKKEQVLGS